MFFLIHLLAKTPRPSFNPDLNQLRTTPGLGISPTIGLEGFSSVGNQILLQTVNKSFLDDKFFFFSVGLCSMNDNLRL